MRLAAALVTTLFIAGCGSQPIPEAPSAYLEDAVGDAEPRYDIVRANLTEFNGSLVLRLEIRNYAKGLPLFDARIDTSLGEFYARLLLEPSGERPEQGRWIGDDRVETIEPCWIPSFPTDENSPGPWLIFIEFLNNRTGFDRGPGGTIRSLSVETMDANGTVRDTAVHESEFRVGGGPNPYGESCPLIEERRRLA